MAPAATVDDSDAGGKTKATNPELQLTPLQAISHGDLLPGE